MDQLVVKKFHVRSLAPTSIYYLCDRVQNRENYQTQYFYGPFKVASFYPFRFN